MKATLRNKMFAIIISVILVAGMSPAAFAAYSNNSSEYRIRPSNYYIELNVGEQKSVLIDYDDLKVYEDDEKINISRATVRASDPKIVQAVFAENGRNFFEAELTGLASGKTYVIIAVNIRHTAKIEVTVKGSKSSSSTIKTNNTTSTSSKTSLETALDSAIKKSAQKDVTISTTDAKTPAITSATLKALAKSADQAKKRAIIRIDSLNSKGKLQARLYLDPASLANLKSDFKTDVSLNTSRKAALGSKYIASVKLAYTGGFSKPTEIAVKVNAPKDVSKLSFYNVDSKGNFKKIANPARRLDNSGALHFFTKTGGEIVIINGTL